MKKAPTPKQRAARGRLKAQMWAESEKRPADAGRKTSWWTAFADPSLPRNAFADAARARDEAMRHDPRWQRPEHLNQTGIA